MPRASAIAIACILVACGTQGAAPSPDAGEAGGMRDAGDAGDAGSSCTSTTRTACIADSGCAWSCPPTWSAALADRSMCVPSCGYQHEFLADCGSYEEWTIAAGDCAVAYYYEKASGQLVALFSWCTGPVSCDFGPPGFTQPATCEPQVEVYPCGDAGSDGGTE